jgi:hypothetical protein
MTRESNKHRYSQSMIRFHPFFSYRREPNCSLIQLKSNLPTWSFKRMIHDIRGLALSGATAASLPRFEAAVRQLNLSHPFLVLWYGDAFTGISAAIADPATRNVSAALTTSERFIITAPFWVKPIERYTGG